MSYSTLLRPARPQYVNEEFIRKVKLFGHDPDLLAGSYEDRIYYTFTCLEEARKRLCNATADQVLLRGETFFQDSNRGRGRLGQGVHDRAEAFVWANGTLSDLDWEGIHRHMPLHAQSIAIAEKVVGPGEQWDISLRGDRWKLDNRDELYTALNVGRLVLHPGASVVVRGNILSLLCQEYVCLGSSDEYQVGILPTPFSVDFGSGPHDGVGGENGRSGVDGGLPEQVEFKAGFLGYSICGDAPETDGAGPKGQDGEPGLDGDNGRTGGMCCIAELTFRSVEGPLTVFGQAGSGGAGGNGGEGGNGGSGGIGRDTYPLVEGKLPPGNGGDGGTGGEGGRAGHGGGGGIASHIYVNVPPGRESSVRRWSEPAPGGPGGVGGAGGKGGAAGVGGIARYFATPTANGLEGCPGPEGAAGRNGQQGRTRPGPIIFLNDRP